MTLQSQVLFKRLGSKFLLCNKDSGLINFLQATWQRCFKRLIKIEVIQSRNSTCRGVPGALGGFASESRAQTAGFPEPGTQLPVSWRGTRNLAGRPPGRLASRAGRQLSGVGTGCVLGNPMQRELLARLSMSHWGPGSRGKPTGDSRKPRVDDPVPPPMLQGVGDTIFLVASVWSAWMALGEGASTELRTWRARPGLRSPGPGRGPARPSCLVNSDRGVLEDLTVRPPRNVLLPLRSLSGPSFSPPPRIPVPSLHAALPSPEWEIKLSAVVAALKIQSREPSGCARRRGEAGGAREGGGGKGALVCNSPPQGANPGVPFSPAGGRGCEPRR